MNFDMSWREREPLSEEEEQALPGAPYPRKHIHCVFDNADDAKQAEQALQNAGIASEDIHVLDNRGFTEAIERGHTPWSFVSSMDYDVYVQEAHQGNTILSVPFSSQEQLMQVRDLLAPYHARLMKYIDTWTTTELLP